MGGPDSDMATFGRTVGRARWAGARSFLSYRTGRAMSR